MDKSDIRTFFENIVAHKNYLVPSNMVEDVVNYATEQGKVFCGGMITDSGNFQYIYTD